MCSPTPNRSRPRPGSATCRTWPLGSPARSGARASATRSRTARSSPIRRSGPASRRSRSRRRGPTCGSAREPNGHILATGRDAAAASSTATTRAGGRSATPTSSTSSPSSARCSPDVRKAVDADLRRRGLPREKVLALVVKLLDETLHPRRQRGVRDGERVVRADHAEAGSRRGGRRRAPLRLHRQERSRARRVPRGQAARPHRAPVPRARRAGPLRLPGRAARSPTSPRAT